MLYWTNVWICMKLITLYWIRWHFPVSPLPMHQFRFGFENPGPGWIGFPCWTTIPSSSWLLQFCGTKYQYVIKKVVPCWKSEYGYTNIINTYLNFAWTINSWSLWCFFSSTNIDKFRNNVCSRQWALWTHPPQGSSKIRRRLDVESWGI